MKLHIQVVEVVIEIALERIASVKISEGRTQPIGAVYQMLVPILYSSYPWRESFAYQKSRRSSHHRCK
jgi:hypothetical protein